MTKKQAHLHGMQTQQGVLFRDLLVVNFFLVSIEAFFLYTSRLRRLNKFGSGDIPFSVRRGSYRSIRLIIMRIRF